MILQHLAKHVMRVHLNALQSEDTVEGELSLTILKKFIAYARSLVHIVLCLVLIVAGAFVTSFFH